MSVVIWPVECFRRVHPERHSDLLNISDITCHVCPTMSVPQGGKHRHTMLTPAWIVIPLVMVRISYWFVTRLKTSAWGKGEPAHM